MRIKRKILILKSCQLGWKKLFLREIWFKKITGKREEKMNNFNFNY